MVDLDKKVSDLQQCKDNTAVNARISSHLPSTKSSPHLGFRSTKVLLHFPFTISGMIWKKTKPFPTVKDIKIASSKIKPFWSKFEINKYTPTSPIAKIMKFIECLVQKDKSWTKTKQFIKVLVHTFVHLTKTSPKVFLGDLKKSGNLYLSVEGSLWMVATKVLGCSFSLQIQIKVAIKNILRNNTKDLKLQGKSLTFDLACVPIKTKTGRFLTGRELR